MSDSAKNHSGASSFDPMEELTHEERILIILREELYEGSWKAMVSDLENRLDDEPYIFKLQNRIEDDLERIEKLQDLEDDRDLDLGDYIEKIEEEGNSP